MSHSKPDIFESAQLTFSSVSDSFLPDVLVCFLSVVVMVVVVMGVGVCGCVCGWGCVCVCVCV